MLGFEDSSQEDNQIFWLASYPKSGNTWFRLFLNNLLNEKDDPVDINELHLGSIASARQWIDNILGLDTADLTHDEIDQLRPYVYQWCSAHAHQTEYHKVHDAFSSNLAGSPIIPALAGVLYIIRNPLDVCISYANHNNSSIDKAISNLGNNNATLSAYKQGLSSQLKQRLFSWSGHVKSWLEVPGLNLEVIRYEDMHSKPLETFTRAARFLKLNHQEDLIAKAIDNASFKSIKQQEDNARFREAPSNTESFFRKGITGDWQSQLSAEQIRKIIENHEIVMRKFGYIDNNGNPYKHIDSTWMKNE